MSSSLDPRFVTNDYVTAELIYNTAHAHHEVVTWSWISLCHTHVWAPPRKQRGWLASWLCPLGQPREGENIACILLWQGISQERMLLWLLLARREVVLLWIILRLLLRLLHQPETNVCSSYGSLHLLPTLSLCLAYPGFSKQWIKQGNCHPEQMCNTSGLGPT